MIMSTTPRERSGVFLPVQREFLLQHWLCGFLTRGHCCFPVIPSGDVTEAWQSEEGPQEQLKDCRGR